MCILMCETICTCVCFPDWNCMFSLVCAVLVNLGGGVALCV